MTAALHLTSVDNPRVKAVVKLREQRQRRKSGLFIAEGRREIERALAAGLVLREMYGCPDMLDAGAMRALHAAAGETATFTVTAALLKKMAYCENPEGALAVFAQPHWELDAVLSRAPGSLWLVAVGIEKPGNLGAMARSADAAGAAGMIVADGVVDAFNPNAIRASTGAVFTLPIVGGSSEQVIAALSRQTIQILTTTPHADRSYLDADYTGGVAIVIGPEDVGLDRRWLSGATVAIPMQGRVVDSLNASAAAAVLLFEAARRRREAASRP